MPYQPAIGRGAGFNPPNRFEEFPVPDTPEDLAQYFDDPDPERKILTKFYLDHTKSILAKNDSPDLSFTYSLNPYRGCEHGCIYCYARPTHEYLGFSSGIDFETKIMVKRDAPALLEEQFKKKSWKPEVIILSGNTDCYQPLERTLQITRGCLEVFLKFRNPVSIITKNALIQRDVDILKELASLDLVAVMISITTLQQELVRKMEPRTSAPYRRLEAIETLAKNGIPVGVNAARFAGHTIVRLPYAVKDLFVDWLNRAVPENASKILNRIRDVRDGELTNSDFGKRMTGEGEIADSIHQLFDASCKKYRLNEQRMALSTKHFRRVSEGQIEIF